MSDVFPYAHWVEVNQLTFSLVALVLIWYSLIDAMKDSTALRMSGANGNRGLIASNNVRVEFVKLCVVFVLCLVGTASLYLPPPSTYDLTHPEMAGLVEMANEIDPIIVEERHKSDYQSYVSRLGAILITFMLLVDSFLGRRFRVLYVRRVRWDGSRAKAQAAANVAQAAAGVAQQAATTSQEAATIAQDVAMKTGDDE